MKILVTGGAGFIGSTVASALIDAGHTPVIVDNFVTGRREFVEGRTWYEGNVSDKSLSRRVFDDHPDIEATVHCAALIVVPESVAQPIRYYEANVVGTLRLVECLMEFGCHRLVFSSSASIYVPGADFSVDEASEVRAFSPYARTKIVVEDMLRDIAAASPLRVMSLRYFNPVGADPQMRTGLQVARPSHALGKLIQLSEAGEPFEITGTDYATRDGSGIRDYVHVWDLAQAHVAALERFDGALGGSPFSVVNLGTGQGTTVRELVRAYESVVGHEVATRLAPARPGDVPGAFTRSTRAASVLGWTADHKLEEGIADTLRWFEHRPSILAELGDGPLSVGAGLLVEQGGVSSAAAEELVVGSVLDDPSVGDDDDGVGQSDGGEAM
ncbi:MAG: UDP-glucose 4-epimerase GalE [Dermatophilaceae bacterium]